METTLKVIDPKEFGLDETKAQELTKGLTTILQEREVLSGLYRDVITYEINEETLPLFRDLRLKIRDNRTKGIEKWHKVNKEFFLTGGRFVDAIKNKESAENEMMEEKLADAEKYFENLEKKRIADLQEERNKLLVPYGFDSSITNTGLMTDEVWESFFSGIKLQHEKKIEAEKKAELDRIAKEKADAEEREKQRIENIRLKAEADKKEAILQAEREKARKEKERTDALLKAEQDKARKLADELKAKQLQDAKKAYEEEQERKRIEAAKRKAEKAPDKEKLKKMIIEIAMSKPELKSKESQEMLIEISNNFTKFIVWSLNKIEQL